MRKRLFLLVALLVASVASAAGAALVNFESFSTNKLGDLPATELTGGGVATLNGSGGFGHLSTVTNVASRGGISGTVTTLVTDPDTSGNGIAAIIIQAQGGSGVFGNISGAVASTAVLAPNTLPVRGVTKICLITTDCGAFLELLLTGPTTVNGVPGSLVQGVGVGGLVTVGAGTSTIRVSLQGAPWTVKTVTAIDQISTVNGNTTFINVTAKGFAHGPASATSSTAAISGVLQIVTPVQVITNLSLGTSKKIGGWLKTTTHYIPEPGLLILLTSGVMGLAALGRKRICK